MNFKPMGLEDAVRLMNAMADHACALKGLHEYQKDQTEEWEAKYFKLKKVVERQIEIIRKLEIQLGVDQEL